MYNKTQDTELTKNIKLGITQSIGSVDDDDLDKFLGGFAQLGEACKKCGITIYSPHGVINPNLFINLAKQMKANGILIIVLQFPDGDKFELVARYNEKQQKVYTFCYQV